MCELDGREEEEEHQEEEQGVNCRYCADIAAAGMISATPQRISLRGQFCLNISLATAKYMNEMLKNFETKTQNCALFENGLEELGIFWFGARKQETNV